jgi:hypothetical protein
MREEEGYFVVCGGVAGDSLDWVKDGRGNRLGNRILTRVFGCNRR